MAQFVKNNLDKRWARAEDWEKESYDSPNQSLLDKSPFATSAKQQFSFLFYTKDRSKKIDVGDKNKLINLLMLKYEDYKRKEDKLRKVVKEKGTSDPEAKVLAGWLSRDKDGNNVSGSDPFQPLYWDSLNEQKPRSTKLPPHLARLVDEEGNPKYPFHKPEDAERLRARDKKRREADARPKFTGVPE